jgi:hypothetical protein
MRRILGSCLILAIAAPVAHAYQQPQVYRSVPNFQASGTTSGTISPPNSAQAPGGMQATATPGTPAATTPGTTMSTPAGNMGVVQPMVTYGTPTYYYYPQRPFARLFRRNMAPTYYYTTNVTQTYTTQPLRSYAPQTYSYTPVRRMWPFGIFGRRYSASPTTVYTAPGYYAAPSYGAPMYGAPTYYGTTTTSAPSGTTAASAAPPVYTPTMYNAPLQTPPGSVVSPPLPR